MSAVRILSGQQLNCQIASRLAPALRAAISSIGPSGGSAIYARGNSVKRASCAIEIIRHFTGDSVEETLLREAFVSAHRDWGDGIGRLAAMFEGALATVNQLVNSGVHPTAHGRAVMSLLPELEQHFGSVTTPYTCPDKLLNTFNLPPSSLSKVKEAINAVGEDGHIEVSASDKPGIQYTKINGFIAGMKALMQGPKIAFSQVYVLVINDILRDGSSLLPIVEGFAKSDKSLIIVARGLEGSARQLLEVNRSSDVLKVAVFEPEQKGVGAEAILTDLAASTGATLVCESLGYSLASLTPDMLGMAESCHSQGMRLIFNQPQGNSNDIALRLKDITSDIKKFRYLELDRENAIRRYARLTGSWVEIAVGDSDAIPGLRDRVSKACAAVRMAKASGVIAGGGVGLTAVAERLDANATTCSSDRAARYMLVRTLQAPQRALRHNAVSDDRVTQLADPAELSRRLTRIAISLALQFMSIEAAVLRK